MRIVERKEKASTHAVYLSKLRDDCGELKIICSAVLLLCQFMVDAEAIIECIERHMEEVRRKATGKEAMWKIKNSAERGESELRDPSFRLSVDFVKYTLSENKHIYLGPYILFI